MTMAKFQRAEALRQAADVVGAEALYREVLSEAPGHAPSIHGMALLAAARENFDAALEFSRIAISYGPAMADYHNTAAAALMRMERFEDAAANYAQAATLSSGPALAEAHYMYGSCLWRMGRTEAAAEAFDRALALKPSLVGLHNTRIYETLMACDWTRYADMVRRASEAVRAERPTCDPFVLTALTSSPADQLACSRQYSSRYFPPTAPLADGAPYRHDKIRLAYVSADFHAHAVSYLMAGLFERHDRERFEVTAISIGPSTKSPIRDRLIAGFDNFIDAREMSEGETAELMRSMEIDIAVDLKGHTENSRTGIFARQPAPIQVNYLGFPGTMAAPYLDYIIGDAHIIPPEHAPFYTEAIVRLPDTYFPTDRAMAISDGTPTRSEAGLPDDAFVFCAFNKSYKLAPPTFDVWMRLLDQVEGSVLWLSPAGDTARANLRREAAARGVDPDRLIFAARTPLREDHLARQRCADLFLDNLPFNAHTTAVDALWAGLPVLTCTGPTFVGRVATSLLTALDMPEMITADLDAYEALALKLAREPQTLAAARSKLARNRLTTPLFDTDRFRRHLEAAFIGIYERHQAGQPIEPFDIARLD